MTQIRALTLISTVIAALATAASAEYRNGKRFDPAREMTARAPGAPEELDRVISYLGQWDVEMVRYPQDQEPVAAVGQAEITLMNRGHGLMESLYLPDVGGRDLAELRFLGFNPATRRWFLAGADTWREAGWIADGGFEAGALVLSDTRRLGGAVTRTEVKYRLEQPTKDRLVFTREESSNGADWRRTQERTYTRRAAIRDFMKPESPQGAPDPDRPAEAAAFDFLIGEWDESQDMTFPNGQRARWTSRGTGVYALNGLATLEYTWFDVDPSLPDAATTILRFYNRAMRRWECLFATNRGHGILHFGGVREGDKIVLHPFAADAATPLRRWVFYDIKPGSYSWHGETSADRGRTWNKTWLIEGTRRATAAGDP